MKIDPSEMFKILGVDTRIRIIDLLKHKGPMGVNKISVVIGITPAAVSQHLKILKNAGLVTSERQGYYIPYSIDVAALENCGQALNKVCDCDCPEAKGCLDPDRARRNLMELKKYEKRLQAKLTAVRNRIEDLNSKTE